MVCNSCNQQSEKRTDIHTDSFIEGFENPNKGLPTNCSIIQVEKNKIDNRCPKSWPTQDCIYTSQGLLICNKNGKEIPDIISDVNLNINQPFYQQTINRKYN